jgi:NADH:ubiquinone oxidoreductase subunit E
MEATQGACTDNGKVGAVLVVGGGIGGMQAALDLAESGFKVYLVEEGPAIGGAMAQLDKTFPTNDCAMCTLAPRLVDCGRHPNVEKLTYSEVMSLEGRPGRFRVRVKKKPRSVDPAKCTGCGECSSACLVRNRAYFEPPEPEPLDLDADQAAEVDRILAQYGADPSSILPVLQDINAKYHWLPGGAVQRVSEVVGLPLARVLRIASFYNMFAFEPRGRHTITVCSGTACHVRGSSRLLDTVQEELAIGPGQTTPDRAFTLEVVNCLGACALAPVLVINETYHEKVTPDKVRRILQQYRQAEVAVEP